MDPLSHRKNLESSCLCKRSMLRRKLQVLRDSKLVFHHATWGANAYPLLFCVASVCDLPRSGTLMLRVMTQETSKDTPQNWQVHPETASMPRAQVGLAYLETYSVRVEGDMRGFLLSSSYMHCDNQVFL